MEPTRDLARFLERFAKFGSAPSPDTYLPIFDPEATLFDSGMERPITVREIPEHIAGILNLVPDFRMHPRRWRERAGTLFVEATNEATVAGTPLRWDSVYCMDLRGDRVFRGRRYYDRQPLFATLNPALPTLPEDARPENVPTPSSFASGPEVPPHLRPLAALLEAPHFEALCNAGDETLAFCEWRLSGRLADAAYVAGGVDRVDGQGGARSYYDTLHLATTHAEAGS